MEAIWLHGIIENGKIAKEVSRDIKEKSDIENRIIIGMKEIIDELIDGEHKEVVERIGISAPGIIANNKIVKASNLNLYDFKLVKKLKGIYPETEITLRNDGKAAALAEKKYGCMKEYKDAVFINIGTGIGGAVFMEGKLLEPKKRTGFEFGHMIIEKDGKQCTCGKRGCFETYCSIRNLKEQIKNKLGIEEKISGKELRKIIEEKPEETLDIIDEYIEYLSIGLSNIIDIFEPQIICFGGSFANYENIMIEKLKKRLRRAGALFSKSDLPELKMATLGNSAGIVGAVLDKS